MKPALTKHITRLKLIGTVGLILIVVNISLQIMVFIPAWRQERINNWRISIPLDLSGTNSYVKSFKTITPWYGCYTRFKMRGPVTEEFIKYRQFGGGNVPSELIRNSFSKMPFKVSWSLMDGQKVLGSGVFISSDINAWVYPNYVYYGYSHYSGLGNLEYGKEYSIIAKVEQPCEALNKLNPTLEIRTESSFKARGAAIIVLLISIPWFIIGVVLLRIAMIKNRLEKKKVEDSPI